MAVLFAVYVYNNTPNANNLCPADLFTGSTVPRHRLRDLHTWDCPVYVLDPILHAGKKLPRRERRSRQGVFVGLSTIHSSEVPLILNLDTVSITPPYHVVFDDRYSTVQSIGISDNPPPHWEDLCLEISLYVPTDGTPDIPVHLHDDWLTAPEREVKYRELQSQDCVRQLQHPTAPVSKVTRHPPLASPLPPPSEGGQRPFVRTHPDGTVTMDNSTFQPLSLELAAMITEPSPVTRESPELTEMAPDVYSPHPPLRQSQRTTKGEFQSTKLYR